MNEGPVSQGHLIETTDCLEAVGVFRGWKNIFFLIVAVCLVLTQLGFWVIDRQFVAIPTDMIAGAPAADPNAVVAPTVDTSFMGLKTLLGKITFDHVMRMIDVVNGLLIVAMILYCLAMFFSLVVSLIGRLGGINHVSRAFFLALIALVLVLPWQRLMESSVIGMIYTPGELVTWFAGKTQDGGLMRSVLYYLRFFGYWAIVMMLVVLSQSRSARWTQAILRRLEII